jgi:hypothetical protein
MKRTEEETRTWNRACSTSGLLPLEGDLALSELLRLHGRIMNGGVQHGIEGFDSQDWPFALEAYRLFGLDDVADFLIDAKIRIQAAEDAGALEDGLNTHYYSSVGGDRIFDAFAAVLRSHPELFAP